jgi:hypothetical protein
MSGQQQTPQHEWVRVPERFPSNTSTYRMQVPGGWLYRVMAADETPIGLVFVPDPNALPTYFDLT